MASPVGKGDIRVCADGPLVTIEIALGLPTPLYLRRDAACEPNDPMWAAAATLRRVAERARP